MSTYVHKILLGIVVIASVVLAILYIKKQPDSSKVNTAESQPARPKRSIPPAPDYSGITIRDVIRRDLKPGSGNPVSETSKVKLSYLAWVYNPAKRGNRGLRVFTDEANKETSIAIGAGQAAEGFEKGILGMRPGGQRELIVPAQLAYGEAGLEGQVPSNAILLFEVTVKGVE